jgi:ribonuclease HII
MLLAGVDEAGRGPLAGPVVAAAVILDPKCVPAGLRDSKQLRPAVRERLARRIRDEALGVAVAEVDACEIDRINILQATLQAMRRALLALREAGVMPGRVMIDGNCAPQLPDWLGSCALETVIGGDALIPVISAASIIAKTYRDALMRRLDLQYPGYGLAVHFGYGTRAHVQALERLGPSPIHRRSFNPLRGWLELKAPTGSLPEGFQVRES